MLDSGKTNGGCAFFKRIVSAAAVLFWLAVPALAGMPVAPDRPALPTLTTAGEVAQLKPAEAQRGYPVTLRGVVISVVPEHQAFVLQDATRGVFIVDTNRETVRAGELWAVDGVTDKGSFAPIVRSRQKTFLGPGTVPSPLKATWDQLVSGSLDDQLVAVQGVVESSSYDPGGWSHVILRTRGGALRVDLPGSNLSAGTLARCDKNLVGIQGCYFAMTDTNTWQVKADEIRIYGARITLEEPDATNRFAIPGRAIAALMQFDPHASMFRRVKVAGQILHVRGDEYFLTDATNGLRFMASPGLALRPGDEVEVVGFPRLGGPTPVLTEAVARKTGHAALPPARRLSPGGLMDARLDSMRVRVQGRLASLQHTPSHLVMEIQTGSWRYLARLNAPAAAQPPLRIGSTLALTGVYAAQSHRLTPGESVVPFELLLNAPADIRVLKTPPWWTLRRLLVVVGVLGGVLVLAGLWINQLHRQVERRTAELKTQIQAREQIEHQRAMEQERARIARDLHDELGSSITEISMLATWTKLTPAGEAKRSELLEQMSEKAREMVVALDEIVWAMNPKHDSLVSLVSYSCLYADRFLKLANMECQLKGTVNLPDRPVSSAQRHEIFLAFKEGLNNVVHHSGATAVRLGVKLIGNRLRLSIADNGRGLAAGVMDRNGNGLVNMRERLEKLGGRLAVASQPGRGTIVRFYLQLL